MISFTAKRVVIPEDVLFRTVDDEAVLLNLNSEQYFGLDPVGARFWAVLTTTPSIQAAYETLITEYDVIPELLEYDLRALLDTLAGHGLIEIHDV